MRTSLVLSAAAVLAASSVSGKKTTKKVAATTTAKANTIEIVGLTGVSGEQAHSLDINPAKLEPSRAGC